MKTKRATVSRTEEQHAVRMLDDGFAQAREAIEEAAWLIWNSIRKFDGDPSDQLGHPIECGCIYCN